MTTGKTSTRRAFLKVGAIAATPLAGAGAAGALAQHDHEAQLARLKDETAIRDLHQAWLRRVNTGEHGQAAALFAGPKAGLHEGLSRVSPDHAAAADAITLAPDRLTASGLYHCEVETAAPRPLDCTLAQMAAAQGEGMIRSAERRVLRARYIKAGDGWAIEAVRFEPA
jgi:hypothetical protein